MRRFVTRNKGEVHRSPLWIRWTTPQWQPQNGPKSNAMGSQVHCSWNGNQFDGTLTQAGREWFLTGEVTNVSNGQPAGPEWVSGFAAL
jgi:hypothetical protein